MRNDEARGVLPATPRSDSGYHQYRALLAAVAERRVALDDRARSMLDSASQPHHQLAEVRGGL
ncbi:hypothetical protein [Actinoalloteichus caeruleus]|uniref:hypothetical protein n=1 Tax=Actinoalloteichus cyanogriseus TaxID=2893586 RepID=UPI003AAB264F